jgi:hypothetical protein
MTNRLGRGQPSPWAVYLFLVVGLLAGALFTADFFGFLVSFFCALLPLAIG